MLNVLFQTHIILFFCANRAAQLLFFLIVGLKKIGIKKDSTFAVLVWKAAPFGEIRNIITIFHCKQYFIKCIFSVQL